jgi:cation transport ATPase
MFRDKFWLSFILTFSVLFWSTDVQRWFGYTARSFPGSRFIPAILGTVVFVYGGLVLIRGAWRELADRKPGMMTLISTRSTTPHLGCSRRTGRIEGSFTKVVVEHGQAAR